MSEYGRCPRCRADLSEWWQNECQSCGWEADR